jgi:hypothetical protein
MNYDKIAQFNAEVKRTKLWKETSQNIDAQSPQISTADLY